MTFTEGITLGIIGTVLTIFGFWLAFSIGSTKGKKEDEEKENIEKFKKLFPWRF